MEDMDDEMDGQTGSDIEYNETKVNDSLGNPVPTAAADGSRW